MTLLLETDRNFFDAQTLRGENFSEAEESAWYDQESDAYRKLGYIDSSTKPKRYPYHAMNKKLGFDRLNLPSDCVVLGIGSAHGEEFEPIASNATRFIVVESDSAFHKNLLFNRPAEYLLPGKNGALPVASNSVDLVTCFGVLHHICRPSVTLREISRVLRPGGTALIREPIVSMGDWRFPRPGLTPNERGIALSIFEEMCASSDLFIQKQFLVGHRLLTLVCGAMGVDAMSHRGLIAIDLILGTLYRNVKYHRTSSISKLTPTSAFWVIKKEFPVA